MRAYLAVFCTLFGLTAFTSASILTNGSFESTADGTTVSGVDFGGDSSTFADWRAFAVAGAGATYRVTSAAANDGVVGMEIARDVGGGDSALDKWDLWQPTPSTPRIYKYLVDARDGGIYGGGTLLNLAAQFQNSGDRGIGYDPSNSWETLGLTARSGANDGLGVRLDVPQAGQSVFLDNVRAIDVTEADRMVNGGFENSDTRTLNWRFFAVAGAGGGASISNDAYEGNNAVLLDRTAGDGDSGLDLDQGDLRVATLGGEEITLSFASKKLSGAENTRLKVNIAAFDESGAAITDLLNDLIIVGTDGYAEFSRNVQLTPDTAFVNVAFRVADDAAAGAIGSYLIDSVRLLPEPGSVVLLMLGIVGLALRRSY